MRLMFRILLVFLFALPIALVGVVYLALDNAPLVSGTATLTPAHIERAKRLIERNDPRRMPSGVRRTVTVSQEDVDLALNYLANWFGQGSAHMSLGDGTAVVRLGVLLPRNPFGRYINIDASLRETQALPEFEHLRIGRVPVPAFVANRILQMALTRLQNSADYGAAADTIKHIGTRHGMLSVSYEWSDAVSGQLKAVLVPGGDQERMKAYQARLVDLTSAANTPRALRLSALVQPLFHLAAQRAAASGGSDAAAENRAALIVMAFYVNGKGLAAIIPAAKQWPAPVPRGVTLSDRSDFSQHFTISAALAGAAGSPLSNAVGLYKEFDDSRGGSGFSFNDIAADRAGTRFGELATGDEAGIQKLQRLLAAGLTDADLLPMVKDLPEFMQEAEFKRRYGSVGAPAYRKMMETIEQRIGALALYR